jgi:hypothetical protein
MALGLTLRGGNAAAIAGEPNAGSRLQSLAPTAGDVLTARSEKLRLRGFEG